MNCSTTVSLCIPEIQILYEDWKMRCNHASGLDLYVCCNLAPAKLPARLTRSIFLRKKDSAVMMRSEKHYVGRYVVFFFNDSNFFMFFNLLTPRLDKNNILEPMFKMQEATNFQNHYFLSPMKLYCLVNGFIGLKLRSWNYKLSRQP